jgi:hypothetical protein
MELSALVFREQFKRFQKAVHLNSKEEFRSFREGLPKEWEGYKEDVYTEGRKRLNWQSWTKKDVQNGVPIVKRVIQAIEIDKSPGMKLNNLVDWDNRYGPARRSHSNLVAALEDKAQARAFAEVLFGLYRDQLAESDAFERLAQLAGRRYDLLAYLFFLKDWDRFMPIAVKTFDQAFEFLGFGLKTSQRCSWENYGQFNDAIRSVQGALKDVAGLDEIRRIDAHSFCWLLVRLKPPTKQSKVNVPLPKPLLALQPGHEAHADKSDQDEFLTMTDEDYSKRDEQRRKLGGLAQEIALGSEEKRLRAANRPDLAKQIEDVSKQPARGYDILSFEVDGSPRHIEVKAARQSRNRISFFLSDNERQKSKSLSNYYFYLVFNAASQSPTVEFVHADQVTKDCLMAIDYFVALIRGNAG